MQFSDQQKTYAKTVNALPDISQQSHTQMPHNLRKNKTKY